MDPLKVVEKITNEIIEHFRLPKKACFPFIKKMISWVYVAGWEEGLAHCAGRKPVIQMDQYGNVIGVYRSLRDAGKAVDVSGTAIKDVCKGKRNNCKGFHWRYIEGPEQIKKIVEGWQEKL